MLFPEARSALPELLRILSAGTKEGNESDDTLAMTCQTANALIMREPEMNKHLLSAPLIRSLGDLSQNVYERQGKSHGKKGEFHAFTSHALFSFCLPPLFRYFPKTKKAAAVLLYNLWSDKELQSHLKKVSQSSLLFLAALGVCRPSRLSLLFVGNQTGSRSAGFSAAREKKRAKQKRPGDE